MRRRKEVACCDFGRKVIFFKGKKMTIAARIQRRVSSASPGQIFTIEEFLSIASPAAINTALSRLTKRGEIDRVRRGLYHKPRVSRFGRTSLRPESVALAAAHGKAPGPTGASAAAALGLTTQIPARSSFAVVGNPPTSVPNVRFIERSNVERVTAGLRPSEVALLEVLRDDLNWVELSDSAVRDRLRELVLAGSIDVRRVRRAAKGEPRRVASKLEALLPA
jgi:predicted transcriptional regulator of viral defense system